jgi:hypothetical protein
MAVIPAKAGIHEHSSADTRTDAFMDPRIKSGVTG